MNIKDIMAKVLKKESLSDAELEFLQSYDADKVANDAAAAVRRKADESIASYKKQLEEATAQIVELTKKRDDESKSKLSESQKQDENIKALMAKVEALEAAKRKSEEELALQTRKLTIRDMSKKLGIVVAPNVVNEKLFYQMMEGHLSGVDVNDESALSSALEVFKKENAGIIATSGSGSGVDTGKPDKDAQSKKLSEMTTEQRAEQLKKQGII